MVMMIIEKFDVPRDGFGVCSKVANFFTPVTAEVVHHLNHGRRIRPLHFAGENSPRVSENTVYRFAGKLGAQEARQAKKFARFSVGARSSHLAR